MRNGEPFIEKAGLLAKPAFDMIRQDSQLLLQAIRQPGPYTYKYLQVRQNIYI